MRRVLVVAFMVLGGPARAQFADPFGSMIDGVHQGQRDARKLKSSPQQKLVGQHVIAYLMDRVVCGGPAGDENEMRMLQQRFEFGPGQRLREPMFQDYGRTREQLRRGAFNCTQLRQFRQESRQRLHAFVPEIARADGVAPALQPLPVPPVPNSRQAHTRSSGDVTRNCETETLNSSFIESAQFCPEAEDDDEGELIVTMRNGGRYRYSDVARSAFEELTEADSPGTYFNSEIRSVFACRFDGGAERSRIVDCP